MFSKSGIHTHEKSDIYVQDYIVNSVFTEEVDKNQFLECILRLYKSGILVNVRRHVAISTASGAPEKCIINLNGSELFLSESEIMVRFANTVYYCRSSLIYNVWKYGYKPDEKFISAVMNNLN